MPLITIVGASGRQGMAQVRQALRAGYEVRALSRQADPFAGSDIEGIDGIDVRPISMILKAIARHSKAATISFTPIRCRRVRTAQFSSDRSVLRQPR